VLTGCERLRALPAESRQIEQVVKKNRLALENIEAVAAEPSAIGHEHTVAAIRRNGEFSGHNVGFVQNVWFVARKDASHRSRIGEHIPSCRNAWSLSRDARETRSVQWQHLILLRLHPEQILQLLEFGRIGRRHIVELSPVIGDVVEFPLGVGSVILHGARYGVVEAIQPS